MVFAEAFRDKAYFIIEEILRNRDLNLVSIYSKILCMVCFADDLLAFS